MHDMFMCHTQLMGLAHKQILAEVVGDRRLEIMIRGRLVITLCLSFLSHLLMHGPTLRPLLAPVVPMFYAIGNALKVIGIDPIGNKPGSPVVDRALYKFVFCHVLVLPKL